VPITFGELPEPNEVTWATGRLTTRTYASRSFDLAFGQDAGQKARSVHKVFDEVPTDDDDDWEWTKRVVYTTPGGRKQLELNVARSAGKVRKIRIQKVPTSGDLTKLEQVLELDRDQSIRLIDLIKALDSIPADGDSTVYVDDQLLRDFSSDPVAMGRAYAQNPARFRALIQSDVDARDVIALQHRREVVKTMRTWLEDDATFDDEKDLAGGPERAWQRLLEANPWVLGIGLGGQLLTSWGRDKLEKVVVGSDIQTVGERVDALLRTNGIVRSLAFAEIEHHRTDLLAEEYRSCVASFERAGRGGGAGPADRAYGRARPGGLHRGTSRRWLADGHGDLHRATTFLPDCRIAEPAAGPERRPDRRQGTQLRAVPTQPPRAGGHNLRRAPRPCRVARQARRGPSGCRGRHRRGGRWRRVNVGSLRQAVWGRSVVVVVPQRLREVAPFGL